MSKVSFSEFESKVESELDLELSWVYWNWMLPATTGYALWILFIEPQFRSLR